MKRIRFSAFVLFVMAGVLATICASGQAMAQQGGAPPEGADTDFAAKLVDVYPNGYQAESVIPGGETQAWSGTSMAAPQVVNLAAKLFARWPKLTAVEVKRLVVDGADEKVVTGRTIRLMNPRRSFELAEALAAGGPNAAGAKAAGGPAKDPAPGK